MNRVSFQKTKDLRKDIIGQPSGKPVRIKISPTKNPKEQVLSGRVPSQERTIRLEEVRKIVKSHKCRKDGIDFRTSYWNYLSNKNSRTKKSFLYNPNGSLILFRIRDSKFFSLNMVR